MIIDLLVLSIFPIAMAFGAANDLFTMKLPNWISLLLVGGFLVLAPLVGIGWADIGMHFAIAAGALVVSFILFCFGWIGGGDAKFFAATCLWFGPDFALHYGVYASVLGGLLTIMLLTFRMFPLPVVFFSQGWLARLHNSREGVPYGIALAAAGLIVYPETQFMAVLGG